VSNDAHLKTWNVYQSAWGPIDEEQRRSLLRQSVADDILYTDPGSQTHGLEELVARIEQSQQAFPGVADRLCQPLGAAMRAFVFSIRVWQSRKR